MPTGPTTLRAHRDDLAQMLALPAPEIDAVLELAEDASCWMPGPLEGTWVIRIPPGQAPTDRAAWLMKLLPGTPLPERPGAVEETCFVLSGGIAEHHAVIRGPGEALVRRAPVRTSWIATDGEACICCLIVRVRASAAAM